MPEHASRPLSAIPFHQGSELRAVANFHEREGRGGGGERALPKKMTIITRSILENLHLMSSFLALLNKNQFQIGSLSTTLCLSFSRVRRSKKLVGAVDITTKLTPEPLFSCINQWPFDPARLAIWHCGSAVQGQPSCEVHAKGTQWRHNQGAWKHDLPHPACTPELPETTPDHKEG